MKNSYLIYGLLFLGNLIFPATHAQQTFRTTPTSVIGYLEYLPQDYNTNSDKYPIVIFLHGLGERGANSTDPAVLAGTINTVNKNGPPKHVMAGTQFPFILISPQLKSNYGDWPTSYVNEVIDYCRTYLRIDERRIYLTGLSLGGGGTWWTAQDFPKTFAAIAPVCGSRNTVGKACNIAGENLPVWAFHGDADGTVPMSRSVTMVNRINECTPAPNPLAKITIYPGVGHNSWENAYKPDHTLHNPNVYEWMLSYTNILNGTNKIPLANAGADVVHSLPATSITMSGAGADADGTISTYAWSQVQGPSITTFVNASTATCTASGLIAGVYVFKLKVTDNSGDTDSDYIKVTVQAGSANTPPVANAGADKTVTLPVSSLTLAGTATDADGSITSYELIEVSGAAATLTGMTTPTLSVSALGAGAYVFRLTVKDNLGATRSDDVVVTVNAVPPPPNQAPVISAGPDRILPLPSAPATLFGVATDEDGTVASFNWVKLSGGSCTFTSTTALRPKISNLTTGTYVFRLTVTDDKGAVSTDDVTIVADYPAVANAGLDLTLTLPANSLALNGSATDSDGTIVSYLWSRYSGPATYTLTNKTTPSVTITNLIAGIYVFKLTVTDNVGVQSVDYATVIVLPLLGGREAATETELSGSDSSSELFLSGGTTDVENTTAVIYNESGKKVYEGAWNTTVYREVLNHKGLYIYNLSKNGKRVSGKVYINESL